MRKVCVRKLQKIEAIAYITLGTPRANRMNSGVDLQNVGTTKTKSFAIA